MSRHNSINTSEFVRLSAEGLNDQQIGARLSVSHDCVYRLRRKLAASGILTSRIRRASESDVVTIACKEVESMLKDKDESYVKGFKDGARWRIKLYEAKTLRGTYARI